jgi:glycosyltransferase involved in cell wall biosynthesis
MKKILVVAPAFPATDSDPIPAFVKDEIINLKKQYPELKFTVLAAHDWRTHTASFRRHDSYDEYRFHYFWPRRFEKLTSRGIMPTLKQNRIYYLQIPFLFVAEFFALLRLTRKIRPDVIYAHWFTLQGITAGCVSSLTKTPFVYTSHSSDVAVLHKVPPGGPFAVRHFTKKARAVTVVSQRSLKKLQAFFNDKQWMQVQDKIAVIPMGVYFPPESKSAEESNSDRWSKILFLGRLAEKKGVQYLLPAFKSTLEKFPNATLEIAGDGPWLEKLQKQARNLKISEESVTFSGYVSGDKKSAAVASADIYVVPSIIADDGDAEGLPVSLMEGLIAGKVCIATNESGADDIIEDGKSGYLIPQKDIAALSNALESALALTPTKRAALQAGARKVAEQFEWSKIAKRHYEHLLK